MAVTLTSDYKLIASKNTSQYSTLKLYGRIYETDDANLRTRIQLQARLYGNGGSSYGPYTYSDMYSRLNADGQEKQEAETSISYSKGKETTLITGTFWISHNASGEAKDKSVSATLYINSSFNGTASGKVNLPNIATTSTISITDPDGILVGANNTLNISNYDNTYKNTITYTLGGSSETIVTDYVGTSLPWSCPDSLVSEYTSTQKAKSGTLTITTTKANGTLVGTKSQTFTFTLYGSTLRPKYSNASVKETNLDCKNAFGETMTYAVLGLSKPRIQATITCHNTTFLKTITIKCGSEEIEVIDLSSSNLTSYTLDYTFQNAMNNNSITIMIMDKRELNGSYYDSYSSETYTPIVLTSQEVKRGDIQTGEVIVSFEGTSQPNSFVSGTPNGIYFSCRYREKGGSYNDPSSGSFDIPTSGNASYSYNTTTGEWSLSNYTIDIADFTALYNKAYDLEVTFYDKCTSMDEKTLVYPYTINKAVPSMSLGESDLQVNGDLYLADENGENVIDVRKRIKQKSAINVRMASDKTITTANTNIALSFNTLNEQIGTGLTKNNSGQVEVGDGVEYVMVSLNANISTIGTAGNKRILILQNSTEVARSMIYGVAGNNYQAISISPFLLKVNSGDKLSVVANCTGTTTVVASGYRDTFFNVMEV